MLRTRSLSGLAAAAATAVLVLAGCSDDGDGDGRPGDGDGSVAGATDGTTGGASDDAADEPTGCTLVSPEDIEAALGIEVTEGITRTSPVGGPDSCEYSAIMGSVEVSPDPDTYFSGAAYEPSRKNGTIAAPAPAERGFVGVGQLLVVKGDLAVLFTAAAPGDTTRAQWTALAEAVAENL